jgi:PqqA peptide cyclase
VTATVSAPPPRPWTLIAELTYACPLRCAYCSNPTRMPAGAPLTTLEWLRVISEAEELGVTHVHFTGGEPLLRADLSELVRHARQRELYVALVTSGVPLRRSRLAELAGAGLDHVQLSLQGTRASVNREVAGLDALEHKLEVASWTKRLGLSLTLNVVLGRHNLDQLEELFALAEKLEPDRLELAHAQYLGWALLNRELLLPTEAELTEARGIIARWRERLSSRMDVVSVLPDYYADHPRACMDGWANRYLVVTPEGRLLPCHAAHALSGFEFENVRSGSLSELWQGSPALQRFRGAQGLNEPCASCSHRDRDFGGCRCQAFALTGEVTAADPACRLAPGHDLIRLARRRSESGAPARAFELRRLSRF